MINSNFKSILISASLLFNFAHKIKNVSKLASLINPNFAYVSKVGISTAALMGSYDSVSGASTEITSPSIANGKVGEDFVYRITTAPRSARNFSAQPLPAGLRMGTGNLKSYILGKPTKAGSNDVTIIASKPGYGTVSKKIRIEIASAGKPPLIETDTPISKVVLEGSNISHSVVVSGSDPIKYQWYHNDKILVGEKENRLLLNNIIESQSGSYHVIATNKFGSTKSAILNIKVKLKAPVPNFSSIVNGNGKVHFKFPSVRGRIYRIQSSSTLKSADWKNLYTIESNGGEIVRSYDIGSEYKKFFRILLEDI